MSNIRTVLNNHLDLLKTWNTDTTEVTTAIEELTGLEDDLAKCKELIDTLIYKCPESHEIIAKFARGVLAERGQQAPV